MFGLLVDGAGSGLILVRKIKNLCLACSLEIGPGEIKKFLFCENIPHNAPPSYR